MAGLRWLKASESLPSVKLPPAEALQAISDKFSARAGSAEDSDSDNDSDDEDM
jgi:hypothetical protein